MGRKTKNQVEGLDKIKRYDIFTNFYHYKMPVPEIFVMDCSNPCISANRGPLFDAIVCDPPYGVRARSKKVGVSDTKKRRQEQKALEKQQRGDEEEDKEEGEDGEQEPYFSMKEHYDFTKVYSDLLVNAAKILRPGGRLVFLFHTDMSLPPERNKFPEHSDFEFVCSSENNLTKHRARHLITLLRK